MTSFILHHRHRQRQTLVALLRLIHPLILSPVAAIVTTTQIVTAIIVNATVRRLRMWQAGLNPGFSDAERKLLDESLLASPSSF
jgi:hypothetical protein